MAGQNTNLALEATEKRVDHSEATDELLNKHGEVPGQNVVDWVSDVEADKRIGLSNDTRRHIASALISSDSPELALTALRDELLDEKPETNKPTAVVIDEVIKRVGENAEEVKKLRYPELKNPDTFYALIVRSLQNTVESAENMDTENVKEVETTADSINDIFEKLRDEVESGHITSDVKGLQNEIDGYVENLKFDKDIFEGSVKKYLELSGVKKKSQGTF